MGSPFLVSKVTGPGSYRLQTLEGDDISNSWNIDQLCCFYALSLDDPLWVHVSITTYELFVVSGLSVLALVSGLLFSKIQHQRLLTDLRLLRAQRTLAAVYTTMYSRSSLYGY
jgi:hypothetical protein